MACFCQKRGISFPGGEGYDGNCYQKYACRGQAIMLPEDAHTLSPWVRCIFKDGEGRTITVSNNSSPEIDNSAVIKSFDFGMSDGLHCKVVIHDQAGSALETFAKNLLRDYSKIDPSMLKFQVEWGWTKAGCPTPAPSSRSCLHYMILDSIETNFVGGKFIHEITGTDLANRMLEGGVEKTYGEDGNLMSLKEAIKQLFTEDPPPKISEVKFLRMENGTCTEYDFEDDSKGLASDGSPKGKWHAKGMDKLQAALSWLGQYRTDRKKGIRPAYQSTSEGGAIIFWEDNKPKCDEIPDWDSNCVGTYVVNGGKASSVIEFNPKIRWDFARMTCVGGNVPEATIQAPQMPQQKTIGRPDCEKLIRPACEGMGQLTAITVSENRKNENNKEASTKVVKAQDEQARAMKLLTDAIEADLVVIGDPALPTPGEGLFLRNLSIVYINPFHLLKSSSECGEWIVKPTCNAILSNKAWLIKRCNHHIQEGHYTTTIGIYLATPGVDLDPDSPWGGSDTGATP